MSVFHMPVKSNLTEKMHCLMKCKMAFDSDSMFCLLSKVESDFDVGG